MEKQLDELVMQFPGGIASESDLLDFAKQAGLDEKEIKELREGFMIIDKTSERMIRLEEHRRVGGTLDTFVDNEIEEIARVKGLGQEDLGIIREAIDKAVENAKSNAMEEE